MDYAYEVCTVVGVVLGLVVGAFFSTGQRDLALWTTWAAVVVAITGGFIYWQDKLWEADANKPGNVLLPGSGETPALPSWLDPTNEDIPKNAFLVFLGKTVAFAQEFPFAILRQDDEPMVVIEKR